MEFGLIVDVETTGLNPDEDKIIEVGFVEFKIHNGAPLITSMYSGIEDPQIPLSEDVKRLTGLQDGVLQNEKINWDFVRQHWQRASVIIAHNAEFDRNFLVRRPELAPLAKHWACSMRHIDWTSKNFGSMKLQYLAADHGFANPFAHRAMFDCATTFRLIAPHLTELIERSYEPEFEVAAVGSPFETKDILKKRGYRWVNKVWVKRVGQREIQGEREFLEREIYQGKSKHSESLVYFNPRGV
jgi:DNA polymerase-3 subunit epsilon